MHDTIDALASLRYRAHIEDVEGHLLFTSSRSEISVPDTMTARQFADHITAQSPRTASHQYGTHWPPTAHLRTSFSFAKYSY